MKRLYVLLLSLLMLLSLAAMGCQKKEEAPKPAETVAPSPTPEKAAAVPAIEPEKKETPAPEKKAAAAEKKTAPKKEEAPEKKPASGY
ncbi:MAG: hypothetical protein ACYC69_00895 [Thermodesulfovibrionales bacterium]